MQLSESASDRVFTSADRHGIAGVADPRAKHTVVGIGLAHAPWERGRGVLRGVAVARRAVPRPETLRRIARQRRLERGGEGIHAAVRDALRQWRVRRGPRLPCLSVLTSQQPARLRHVAQLGVRAAYALTPSDLASRHEDSTVASVAVARFARLVVAHLTPQLNGLGNGGGVQRNGDRVRT